MQLDVFTDRAFSGNALAVFPEAAGITDEEMQRNGARDESVGDDLCHFVAAPLRRFARFSFNSFHIPEDNCLSLKETVLSIKLL